MRSLIIIEVEHSDDTDGVLDFVMSPEFLDSPKKFNVLVRDYAVRTDIPPFLTAVNVNAVIDRGAGVTQ